MTNACNRAVRTWVMPKLTAAAQVVAATMASAQTRSGTCSGAKANGGAGIWAQTGTARTLTLSPGFKVPGTPAPHWQVVDSRGHVYRPQMLTVTGLARGAGAVSRLGHAGGDVADMFDHEW